MSAARQPSRSRTAKKPRVVIVGAGVGGLAAALDLSASGLDVTVLERATGPGGKMRQVPVGPARIDAGPTVFTMRWVFDEMLAAAGTSLEREVALTKLAVLARHAWSEDARLDLFADTARSADAIGTFAGAGEARRFVEFCVRAQRVYRTLENPFLRAPRGGTLALVRRSGPAALADLARIAPFTTLWRALGKHFRDPRLRQLFGRYATYCGSSPFEAPAVLMLVAHVERDGVWTLAGGMHTLAQALVRVARGRGAAFRFDCEVSEVWLHGDRAAGVRLASGERIAADAVIVNADASAVGLGLLGSAVARAAASTPASSRSLSAVTWATVTTTAGFPLLRHNVFFSDDYEAEFDALFRRAAVPRAPTVYVCAQDRDEQSPPPDGDERLLCLINAPAVGDHHDFKRSEIRICEERTFAMLERCGLTLRRDATRTTVTTPTDFARLYPGTGGALYGRATHGWRASFQRPGARTSIPRLYLAGGSTHPGPGVPMAALSGRLAAASVLSDFGSTRP